MYWSGSVLLNFCHKVSIIHDVFPLSRYYHVRHHLKGYYPSDVNDPARANGWKAARPIAAVQVAFRETQSKPDQFLSADEGMAQGTATRNPIFVSLGKAKPLEGYRMFLLVDYYRTKLAVRFVVDTKQFTAANCAGIPGAYVGAIMIHDCTRRPAS